MVSSLGQATEAHEDFDQVVHGLEYFVKAVEMLEFNRVVNRDA